MARSVVGGGRARGARPLGGGADEGSTESLRCGKTCSREAVAKFSGRPEAHFVGATADSAGVLGEGLSLDSAPVVGFSAAAVRALGWGGRGAGVRPTSGHEGGAHSRVRRPEKHAQLPKANFGPAVWEIEPEYRAQLPERSPGDRVWEVEQVLRVWWRDRPRPRPPRPAPLGHAGPLPAPAARATPPRSGTPCPTSPAPSAAGGGCKPTTAALPARTPSPHPPKTAEAPFLAGHIARGAFARRLRTPHMPPNSGRWSLSGFCDSLTDARTRRSRVGRGRASD